MRKVFSPVLVNEVEGVAAFSNRIPLARRQAGVVILPTRIKRTRLRRLVVLACASALALSLTGCSVQTIVRAVTSDTSESAKPAQLPQKPKLASHPKKAEPKPPPSREELFEFVRSRLLSLSPSDGVNDNLEVAYNPDISILTITQPDGRCDIFLNSIDNNSAVWEIVDPSETNRPRAEVLRLTVNSVSGKKARACYDAQNQIDTSLASNRARLFFSLSKTKATPGFTEKMDKAIKELVVASGGAPEKQVL
jgi:hypothetical protein